MAGHRDRGPGVGTPVECPPCPKGHHWKSRRISTDRLLLLITTPLRREHDPTRRPVVLNTSLVPLRRGVESGGTGDIRVGVLSSTLTIMDCAIPELKKVYLKRVVLGKEGILPQMGQLTIR